ncbi:pyridoxamine 5'-phosphate oxidase family protein [Mucilaginibacter psychrotolerans]|uniref:Pyridoxamine 5'-phosphate oxidase family protein n=1 Tax=Mucilaginibacter psychrotolerans TaxID=1524096 RepID=A0A4Y8S3K1_9SPHI|nr:pyridoxamine 5'-phosphate oxidase family protein [Mucilaginibacter psychrotolerans]TFF33245.1 pyridoxamine 5'-phosphate oxidase family protein [Mucilaginibacter psychrotolerans]
MAKFFDELNDKHREFIGAQKIFFTASSPLDAAGHVNLSPKGMDSFRVLSPTRVAYMDINGSGNETSAHMLENGRITIMFCAFDGPPNILRLYGKGYTVLPGHEEWGELSALFHLPLAARQVIVADIHKVQTSCGFGIPYYEYLGERDQAIKWAENKGAEGIEKYQAEKNRTSMDGLPTAMYDEF